MPILSMRLDDLLGKNVVMLGYGKEGMAMVNVLKGRGISATITDERPMEGVAHFSSINDVIARADANTVVIKSPGIPWHRPAVEELGARGAVFTSSTNLFMAERKGRGKIIGVTGTKGKSTTASLLAHVLRAKLVGNIGQPAIAEVDAADDTVFVIEMSSYQLADLNLAPDIAVLINLYEEHMDWHGDISAYQAAKMRIAELQTESDVFVYNEKFPQLRELAGRVKSTAIPFSRHDDAVLSSLALLGEHNKENACAVLAVARFLGVTDDVIAQACATFQPLPHRLEIVGEVGGITYVNDSISTTPQSAMAAIEVFKDRLGAIILGGQDRGYAFDELARRVVGSSVTTYIMPGGERIAEAIREAGGVSMPVKTLEEAVAHVKVNLKPGQVCLLSPASPSYGQFKNFEERGDMFKVAALK